MSKAVILCAGCAVWCVAACGRINFDPLGVSASDAPDGSPGMSCETLASTCGPTGTSPCCESPVVPGGAYARSYDVAGDGMYPSNTYGATVSAFRLDKYEVTVGRFRRFVVTGQGTQASPPLPGAGSRTLNGTANQGGWDPEWNGRLAADTPALVAAVKCNATYQTWTDAPGGNESRPMNCVTWYEARTFCEWDGGFLATEAEWNYAASGGTEQRAYPWSSPPSSLALDNSRASYNDGTTCVGDGMNGCAVTDLVTVGSKPAGDGRWGQSDLGGNVSEWTLDWYVDPYSQNPCIDCANITEAFAPVARGGSFNSPAIVLRAGDRLGGGGRFNFVGFRCARTP